MDVTENTLLRLEHRPVELGRIRLGAKAVTAKGKEYPTTLDTWRLTSAQKGYLDAAAALYRGTVEPWTDAPDEGYWQLVTEATELRILIPTSLRTVSQSYELWTGGACERRCDGTYEQLSDGPCLCEPTNRACDLMTRVSIMLPDVPGLGVWRLDTSGYHAATSLPATIELLKSLSTQPWIPAILRLEQRSKRVREDGKVITHRFAVPVVDLPGLTVGKVIARQNVDAPRIEATAPERPTAAERVAQRAAAISAGAQAVIPVSSPGSTDPGKPTPAPLDEPVEPAAEVPSPPGDDADGLASSPGPSALPTCGVASPYDDGDVCDLPAGHRNAHRGQQATWT